MRALALIAAAILGPLAAFALTSCSSGGGSAVGSGSSVTRPTPTRPAVTRTTETKPVEPPPQTTTETQPPNPIQEPQATVTVTQTETVTHTQTETVTHTETQTQTHTVTESGPGATETTEAEPTTVTLTQTETTEQTVTEEAPPPITVEKTIEKEPEISNTTWLWIALGVIAAAVLGGALAWYWRGRRSAGG